jgi:hypothetical protein
MVNAGQYRFNKYSPQIEEKPTEYRWVWMPWRGLEPPPR